mgnify:CR=1 FL=1
MAYSDYGGYAYRNGVRVEFRSDAVIKPDGDLFATPGMWPGFAADITTGEGHNREKRVHWPSGHAIIGDGPINLSRDTANPRWLTSSSGRSHGSVCLSRCWSRWR